MTSTRTSRRGFWDRAMWVMSPIEEGTRSALAIGVLSVATLLLLPAWLLSWTGNQLAQGSKALAGVAEWLTGE